MKLLYIYAENYPPFNKLELNFDSNIRFIFNCCSGQPTLTIRELSVIPFRFFRSGLCHEDFLASVSAVVGVNGSGKTTLADLIRRIIDNNSVRGNFIVAIEISGKVFIRYRFAEKGCVKKSALVLSDACKITRRVNLIGTGCPENIPAEKFLSNANLTYLYMSPSFTTERKVGCDNVHTFDMSTTALLASSVDKYGVSGVAHFNSEEKIRVLRMVREFAKVQSKKIPSQTFILKSNGVYLNFQFAECWYQLEELSSKDFVIQGGPVKKLYCLLRKIPFRRSRKRHKTDNFPLQFFLLLSVRVLYEQFRETMSTGMLLERNLPFDYLTISTYICHGIDALECCGSHAEKVSKAEDLIAGLPDSEKISHQYKTLYALLKKCAADGVTLHNNGAYFSFLEMESATNDFLRAVGINSQIPEPFRLFACDVCPKLSAGEMVFLGYWGRLLDFLDSQGWRDGNKHQLILFLDEIETSLHPEWQRKLVWDTIRFFETFAPLVRVHVIFASHSPILLSDIPKGNICFLPIRRKARVNVRIDKIWRTQLSGMVNTFALDIFDLYRFPFFLHNGTIGEFARNKLKLASERYNGNTKGANAILKLIGDDFLRGCIAHKRMGMKNETD